MAWSWHPLLRQNAAGGCSTVLGLLMGKGLLWSAVTSAEEWMLAKAFQPAWKSKHSPACHRGICDLVCGRSHPDPRHWKRLVWPPACRGGTLISQREDHKKLWNAACTAIDMWCLLVSPGATCRTTSLLHYPWEEEIAPTNFKPEEE